ncbi:MAG: hypothetical protein GX600_08415 [Dehalococcoidia bacterium]|jgi:hypothetical protein|nr:hypothetical protein [Dehalococcoidia bacterium]
MKTWKPTAAGVLAIVAGALTVLTALALSLLMPIAASSRYTMAPIAVFGILWLACGIVAIIGGIFALQRRHWGLALAGAICALIPPATLLGIVSTVFVALSRDEFEAGGARQALGGEKGLLSSQPAHTPSGECSTCDTTLSEPSEGERNA